MRKTIQELTGLRGVAALLILIGHSVGVAPVLKNWPTAPLMNVLTLCGMSVFFILSGIVICYNYQASVTDEPSRGIPRFFLARFARLYPLYIVVVLGAFVLELLTHAYHGEFLGPDTAAEVSALPVYLAGMQSWFYAFINDKQFVYWMGPGSITWSISTEFALYFCFIPIAFALKRFRCSGLRVMLLGAVLFAAWYAFAYYCPWLAGVMDRLFPGHPGEAATYFTYRSPIPRLFEFLSGCGIALLYRDGLRESSVRTYRIAALLGVLSAAALIALMALRIIDFNGCRALLASPCMVALCFAVFVYGSKILRSRPLGFMGDVSYSTYLIHPFFGYLLSFFGNPPALTIPNLLVHFGLTYLTAWGVYKLYEVPMRRKIRAFFA